MVTTLEAIAIQRKTWSEWQAETAGQKKLQPIKGIPAVDI